MFLNFLEDAIHIEREKKITNENKDKLIKEKLIYYCIPFAIITFFLIYYTLVICHPTLKEQVIRDAKADAAKQFGDEAVYGPVPDPW